jgi:hypothetical protein
MPSDCWQMQVEFGRKRERIFEKLFTTNDPTAIGTLVTGIVTAFGVAVAILAGFYAKEQLFLGRRVALGNQLFRIDEALEQHRDIHAKLRPGGEWSNGKHGPQTQDDWIAVERYMGLFERIQVLVQAKVVDIGTVDRLDGYRLFNIVDNPLIFQEKFVELGYGCRDFIKLWKALCTLERNRGKRKPDGRILNHLK